MLSEQLIVDTALRMLREHGSAGLTARRLGLALDADPSTLYRYFRGMDELTLAIGDALIGQALARLDADGGVARGPARPRAAHPRRVRRPSAGRRADHQPGHRPGQRTRRRRGRPGRPAHAPDSRCRTPCGSTTPSSTRRLAFAALDAASLALPSDSLRADEDMWRSTYARLPARHPSPHRGGGAAAGRPDGRQRLSDGSRHAAGQRRPDARGRRPRQPLWLL